MEDGKRRANQELCKLTELSDVNSPKHFKDKAKKWLKFVTQVMSFTFPFQVEYCVLSFSASHSYIICVHTINLVYISLKLLEGHLKIFIKVVTRLE